MLSRRVGLGSRALVSPCALGARASSARPILASKLRPQWRATAWESTTTGEDKTGHIAAKPNESILWFDNLFPLRLAGLFRFPWQSSDQDLSDLLKNFNTSNLGITDPINMVKRAIPETLPMKVTEILPRLKDGGAFVKFTHPPELLPEDIEGTLTRLLRENPVRPFFNPFRSIRARLVKGVPWLEDLNRFPRGRIRVEFVPKEAGEEVYELSQETLYSLFRPYGKVAEILSQPSDSKVLPKYAYVDFSFVRDSILARNCLHGLVVPDALGGGKNGTKLRLSYEDRAKAHRIWDWITNHPRIVIPIIVALITGISVVVFDPIRTFFVKAHVQRSFRLTNNRWYRWLRRQTNDIWNNFRRNQAQQAGLDAIFSHRRDLTDQITKWLQESAQTFVIVQGPPGSGKRELIVDQVLKGRPNVLVLDCKPIAEARGDAKTLKKLAGEVGYRPMFSWTNSLSSMVDIAVQSTTGVKAGFSETLESQLQKILNTTATALSELDLADRKKTDPDYKIPADAYLEAHPEKRAVVVIDNFLHKSDGNPLVYEKLAEWAAALVQSNTAHVIFLTRDTSFSKSLSKALPDRIFRQVALGDISPEIARRYVLSHLQQDEEPVPVEETPDGKEVPEQQPRLNLEGLEDSLNTLGGRLTDLEFLARRLKSGQTPIQAVKEITEQSASEILKLFLLPGGLVIEDRRWSTEQAWYLIKALASGDSLRYNEVLMSGTFASSLTASNAEAALDGLANAELISIKSDRGRPQKIIVGKPVYQAAFAMLKDDSVLSARMDLAILTELAKIEGKTVEKVENELALLGGLPRQPPQTAGRITYLLTKLDTSQKKIVAYEQQMGELKKILSSQY